MIKKYLLLVKKNKLAKNWIQNIYLFKIGEAIKHKIKVRHEERRKENRSFLTVLKLYINL